MSNPLDEIAARAEAATKGPWTTTGPDTVGQFMIYDGKWSVASATVYNDPKLRDSRFQPQYIDPDANAEFIAHARSDVPRLVAALRAVEAVHVKDTGHNPKCHCGIKPNAGATCKGCRRDWPCPTITAIREALEA